MDSQKDNNQAFSVIEVIVAVSIIALLAGSVMANYKTGDKTNKLVMSANNLSTHLREAQNNSLGAIEYGDTIPDGGWGIHIDINDSDDSYKLFANTNYDDGNNLSYDPGEAESSRGGKTLTMESGVTFATTTAGPQVDISFVPPAPETIIYNGASTSEEVEITLEHESGETRKVKVNSFGLIEVLR